MKPVLLKLFLFFLVPIIITSSSCQRENDLVVKEQAALKINFSHQVTGQPLIYGTTYTNSLGEDSSVSKFKYYISKIRLENTSTGHHTNEDEEYFLVDEGSASSKTITIQSETGTYNAVSFLLGVDSIRNVSGAQTGTLDPANDMFWTWNSGYIMAKLEGHSPLSTLVNNEIEYHIGGFKGEDNVVKRITLPFNQSVTTEKNKTTIISINAEIGKWFKNTFDLPIAVNPACIMPGQLATQYAANYRNMFSVSQIQNN